MKYLIDGVIKQVSSLAHQWKYLKKGDEYRVYDPTWTNLDGEDFAQISNFYIDGEKVIYNEIPEEEKDDTRRFKITSDFDTSLEWCDCYVNLKSIPFELTNCSDIDYRQKQLDEMLGRIEKAKSLNKKIFLGNMFSEEYEDVIYNYPNCINKLITKKDLDSLKDYSYMFTSTIIPFKFYTTMIVGTNSCSGKFSSALKIKRKYEEEGEKVVLFHTEETYPFLDDQNGTIKGFCRNFSELTTDEDLQYFQCLIAKTWEEQHPDRIIFVTQAGFGIDGIIPSYQDTNNGRKMKGLWDVFITRSFGLNEVIITTNINTLERAEKLIDYYSISSNIKVKDVFLNPIMQGFWDYPYYLNEEKTKFSMISQKMDIENFNSYMRGFQLKYPELNINTNYGNSKKVLDDFKKSEDYNSLIAEALASDFLTKIELKVDDSILKDVYLKIQDFIKNRS